MNFDEYRQHDGLGLAQLVHSRQVTATELLNIALARASAVNPALNAVTMRMDGIARERAATPLDGPFAGVPFLMKDLEQHYAGVPCSNGCQGLKAKGLTSPHHSELTQRWLDSGVVIFGRTNTPEFGLLPITEPLAWGATRNPWNLALSPGGSSGGSAAAIAAGIVPMAGGNDVGGSIRIPAAVCGLFGFKPGRGRTPWGPGHAEMMHGAAVNHVLTRSVRDSAAMLDATHGKELGSTCHLADPERPYAEEVRQPPGRLRVAFCTRSPLGTEVAPEARLAVENTARLLESLGHHVEEAEPPIDWEQMFADVMTMMYANCAGFVAQSKRMTGCGNEGFEPDTVIMAKFGHAVRGDEYAASLARWNDYQCAMASFHRRYDVYMTPTVATSPPRIGENATPWHEQKIVAVLQVLGLSRMLMNSALMREKISLTLKHTPFTELANLTGVPAMSVPLHWTPDGLPLGVHFMAAVANEGLLFRLAGQLEEARPWLHRMPDLASKPSSGIEVPGKTSADAAVNLS